MLNTIVRAGAGGAGAASRSASGSGSDKMMRLLAAPAPQQCLESDYHRIRHLFKFRSASKTFPNSDLDCGPRLQLLIPEFEHLFLAVQYTVPKERH
jgi:hypothetical protein